MSYRLPDLGSGNGIKIGWFILLHCLGCKIYSSWGEIIWVNVHLVYDTDIRGWCNGNRTTWGRRGYNISQMVLGLLETVSFNGRLMFERWVEIQVHGGVGLMLLKVAG